MRFIIIAALVLAAPSFAHAQDESSLRRSRGLHVAVIDANSREWQGRLLEVAAGALVVEIDSGSRQFALSEVKRVDAHGDKVWDGAWKGAAFGAFVGLVVGAGGRFAAQAAVSYALVGLGLDALNSCNHTVYRARPVGVTVTW
jgi:hypothetical protein